VIYQSEAAVFKDLFNAVGEEAPFFDAVLELGLTFGG